jgi:NAD(P)H dehydrogenase (quinone)
VKTLVVYCHPSHDSFVAAVLEATVDGLRDGEHDVRVTDLYAEGFDPIFSATDHANHLSEDGARADIAGHAEDLRWCESLVLVYPTWWAGQPAMLKGWIDRVWVSGVAWKLPAGKRRLRPLLRNVRRITVVTTHGSSKVINALEGEAGKRTATRSLRLMCARTCRTRWVAMYTVDTSTDLQRAQFLHRVRLLLAA